MNLLLGHDEAVATWVASRVGKSFHAPFTAIGAVDATGHLQGGFVFTGYNGSSVELSLAGHGVAQRGLWRVVLAYVFGQLKCSRLQIHTARDNLTVRHLAPRLGFTFEGKSRNFYGSGRDALVYALVSDNVPAFWRRWRL
jgi:RimJ/RimL family protein N-acetyltransferase